jgi:hypothetical protein
MPASAMHQSPAHSGPTVLSSSTSSSSLPSSSSSSNTTSFRTVFHTSIRGLSGRLQSSYVTLSSSHSYHHQSSHPPIFPEMLPYEKRLERYSYRISQLRVTPYDVQRVTNDPEQFVKLQETIRQQHCITDSFLRQTYYDLIRDRVKEMRPPQQPPFGTVQHQRHNNNVTNSVHGTNTPKAQNGNNENNEKNNTVTFVPLVSTPYSNSQLSSASNHETPSAKGSSVSSSYDDTDFHELEYDYNDNISSSSSSRSNNTNNDKKESSVPILSPTSVAMTFGLSPEQYATLDASTTHSNKFNSSDGIDYIDSEDDDIRSAGECDNITMIEEEDEEDEDEENDNDVIPLTTLMVDA